MRVPSLVTVGLLQLMFLKALSTEPEHRLLQLKESVRD